MKGKRKLYYVISFLVLILVFVFGLSCSVNSEEIKESENLEVNKPEIVNIAYLVVGIIVNGIVWKSSKAEGEYCIATASGYYDLE
ncbi:unnamed protein product [marine sediment metagenome]|uniref:Uncharacterized protein n=1 Tax=marine sediment metagenome TaxID=412755 RepID=X1ES88_9ZZZZ